MIYIRCLLVGQTFIFISWLCCFSLILSLHKLNLWYLVHLPEENWCERISRFTLPFTAFNSFTTTLRIDLVVLCWWFGFYGRKNHLINVAFWFDLDNFLKLCKVIFKFQFLKGSILNFCRQWKSLLQWMTLVTMQWLGKWKCYLKWVMRGFC